MFRMKSSLWILGVVALFGLWAAPGESQEDAATDGEPTGTWRIGGEPLFTADAEVLSVRPPADPNRKAFFGDLHVHTTYSFDAYAFGTLATPRDAYRYAKGEVIQHPGGFDVQLRQPLDFYAVTDHAMFLGVLPEVADPTTELSKLEFVTPLHNLNAEGNRGTTSLPGRIQAFSTFLPNAVTGIRDGTVDPAPILDVTRAAWADTVDAAELFNEPGRFTTFVAYEYTSSTDDRGNLHRNVIFADSDKLPAVPFSRFHSQNPEGLWDWMDQLREEGIESLAIPHNSNGSNGQMFELEDWAGDPIDDAYAERRSRNEPLVEITQVKGTSETHPALSTTDEWADFEIMPYRVATMLPSDPPGSYVRDAWRRGLELESKGIKNPYDFGVVAASDTHTAAISDDESNFFSKVGLLDATPSLRGSTPIPFLQGLFVRFTAPQMFEEVEGRNYLRSATPTYGASGVAGVWAEENTRDAIYAAFRRKETFATSGPRIRVRFFAGYDYADDLVEAPDAVAQAYAGGVSMGADLAADGAKVPRFAVWSLRDPLSAPLQRLQIVKGWVTGEGETDERVYDVACSDGGTVDPTTHRCPDNGASVDLSDCSYSQDSGAPQLSAVWQDPDFDPAERAFYYARVLENPTCRWSTWDALREGVERRPDLQATLQERAWTSPIDFLPAR